MRPAAWALPALRVGREEWFLVGGHGFGRLRPRPESDPNPGGSICWGLPSTLRGSTEVYRSQYRSKTLRHRSRKHEDCPARRRRTGGREAGASASWTPPLPLVAAAGHPTPLPCPSPCLCLVAGSRPDSVPGAAGAAGAGAGGPFGEKPKQQPSKVSRVSSKDKHLAYQDLPTGGFWTPQITSLGGYLWTPLGVLVVVRPTLFQIKTITKLSPRVHEPIVDFGTQTLHVCHICLHWGGLRGQWGGIYGSPIGRVWGMFGAPSRQTM